METIYGKDTELMRGEELAARIAGSREVLVDLGTGDGRFVVQWARQVGRFALGIDACRENLREVSRRRSSNTLFVIANAETLPVELAGLATQVTINFPWGSLLEGLVTGKPGLIDGLCRLLRPGAGVEVRLNGGALAEAGLSLEQGGRRVEHVLRSCGLVLALPAILDREALRACPTSWAKRLAFGRDPRALLLCGRWPMLTRQVEVSMHRMAVESY